MAAYCNDSLPFGAYLNTAKPDLAEIIDIFIRIARQVQHIHSQNIVHNDIHPGNVHVDPQTTSITIRSSGLSFVLAKQPPKGEDDTLHGQIAYLAPERSFRAAHAVDFRSDGYSLGVMLYEALTRTLPFAFENPIDVIHAHQALTPVAVHKINSAIPMMLSSIVMKLIAKHPEDRYKSMAGLTADLMSCSEQFRATGQIAPFPLAKQDISPQFDIPYKLYGRHKEIKLLSDTFKRIRKNGSVEIILVSGPPGIGKSFLVHQIQSYLVKEKGRFISGKFDQFENTPYSALIQAFSDLTRQLLTLPDKAFGKTRKTILDALGANGQVITDVIPELERIIGKQPDVAPLPPAETQYRFTYMVQKFIGAIASTARPLILFLDDLQWADSASLTLMSSILSDINLANFLFIGSYRDIEAQENLQLQAFIETLHSKQPPPQFTALCPVNEDYIEMLLEDMLGIDVHKHRPFVSLVITKTNGNPLFIKEFITSLYEKKLIRFIFHENHDASNGWCLDTEGAQQADLPDNIVALLTRRLLDLPGETKTIMMHAACIGLEFTIQLLSEIYSTSSDDMLRNLHPALEQALVVKTNDGYRFIHDRVQEAAYGLLNDPSQKANLHYTIGKALWSTYKKDRPDSILFSVVQQFNAARDLLSDDEREKLVQLNLNAGQKAKRLTAYTASLDYFTSALQMIPDSIWEADYPLALTIYTEAAEAAYLCANFNYSETLIQIVIHKAVTPIDKTRAYEIRIRSLFAQNDSHAAIREGLDILSLLDDAAPKKPTIPNVIWNFTTIVYCLIKKPMKTLYQLPVSNDQQKIAASRIMHIIGYPLFITRLPLFGLFALRGLSLSLRNAMTPETPPAFAFLAVFLCTKLHAISTGYRFGQLASALAKRIDSPATSLLTALLVNSLVLHWKHPLIEAQQPLLDTYKAGLESGNIEFAFLTIVAYCYNSLFSGEALTEVLKKVAYYSRTMQQYKQEVYLAQINMLQQYILNVTGLNEAPDQLRGPAYDTETMLPVHHTSGDKFALSRIHELQLYLNYMFGDYGEAVRNATAIRAYLHYDFGMFNTPVIYFFDSLSRLALIELSLSKSTSPRFSKTSPPTLKWIEKQRHLQKVATNQRKLRRWAHHAPANFLHKWLLVEAERARIRKRNRQAMDHYQRAISLSEASHYLSEEALANELFAKYYAAQHDDGSAARHFHNAYTLYEKWGAQAKCHQLEKEYEQLFPGQRLKPRMQDISIDTRLPATLPGLNFSELDVRFYKDVLGTIANQDDVTNRLSLLSGSIMKYSGAQRMLLLINRQGNFSIGIDTHSTIKESTILTPLKKNATLFPAAIVNYAFRMQRTVVLENASESNLFAADPYVQRHNLLSVICMPLIYENSVENSLSSVLYLENKLNSGVFVPHHQKILKGLCGQIVLLLENKLLKEALLAKSAPASSSTVLTSRLTKKYGLTPQEAKVASLFKEGHTRSQISDMLNISYKTLKQHLQMIYDKTLHFEEDFGGEGRVDKLSRLIVFLYKEEGEC